MLVAAFLCFLLGDSTFALIRFGEDIELIRSRLQKLEEKQKIQIFAFLPFGALIEV
jgi:hypothetical protein